MLSESFVSGLIKIYPYAEGRVALDIGAHKGDYTELLAQKFDKVYAFEPFPDNIKKLKERFADNPRVVIVEKAVHKKTGTERFYVNGVSEQGSLSKIYADSSAWNYSSEKFIEVETITLDDFITQEKLTSLGIIKIDIEGAEQYIFRGATQTLRSLPPIVTWIIMESHLLVDWDMITDIFKDYGYTITDTDLQNVDHMDPCNHYLLHRGTITWERAE